MLIFILFIVIYFLFLKWSHPFWFIQPVYHYYDATTNTFELFAIDDEFDDVIEHIEKTEKKFNLKVKRFECSIAQVFNIYNNSYEIKKQ
jgi:hypothetical protein